MREMGCLSHRVIYIYIYFLSIFCDFFVYTDAWGGHYFALGGALQGHHGGSSSRRRRHNNNNKKKQQKRKNNKKNKKFIGQYPNDLTSNSPLDAGRGRMIPTTSWETMLSPFMEWMGAKPKHIVNNILPNLKRNPLSGIVPSSDLFG